MTKIIFLSLMFISLTACSSDFSHPEPLGWQSIEGELKPINPDMITHRTMQPITTHHDK
jgi:hypothetical protein